MYKYMMDSNSPASLAVNVFDSLNMSSHTPMDHIVAMKNAMNIFQVCQKEIMRRTGSETGIEIKMADPTKKALQETIQNMSELTGLTLSETNTNSKGLLKGLESIFSSSKALTGGAGEIAVPAAAAAAPVVARNQYDAQIEAIRAQKELALALLEERRREQNTATTDRRTKAIVNFILQYGLPATSSSVIGYKLHQLGSTGADLAAQFIVICVQTLYGLAGTAVSGVAKIADGVSSIGGYMSSFIWDSQAGTKDSYENITNDLLNKLNTSMTSTGGQVKALQEQSLDLIIYLAVIMLFIIFTLMMSCILNFNNIRKLSISYTGVTLEKNALNKSTSEELKTIMNNIQSQTPMISIPSNQEQLAEPAQSAAIQDVEEVSGGKKRKSKKIRKINKKQTTKKSTKKHKKYVKKSKKN